MKLRVQPGPLPIAPPCFEWEGEETDLIENENEDEIDLTEMFEVPKPAKDGESVN